MNRRKSCEPSQAETGTSFGAGDPWLKDISFAQSLQVCDRHWLWQQ